MKFHTDSSYQEDLQPALEHLHGHLRDHGLTDDAAGRAQAIRQILEEPPKPGRAEAPYFKHLKILVNDYDPTMSSRIDPWLEAVVASRPDIARMLFVKCIKEGFKLDGLVALLRVGVDLTLPVPDLQLTVGKKGTPGQVIIDASPIAAMMCYLDHEGWPLLEQNAYDTTEYLDGGHAVRTALMIGAGADLKQLESDLSGERYFCLPLILADASRPEFREYIVRGLESVAAAGKAEQASAGASSIFDVTFHAFAKITPLHRAAAYGYPEVVASYIAAGADVNAVNEDLETPLHAAVMSLNAPTENIEILLNAGADIEAKTRLGFTAEAMARNNGKQIVVQMIAAHRARHAVENVLNRAHVAHSTSSKS